MPSGLIWENGAVDIVSESSFSRLHEAKLEWVEGEQKVKKKVGGEKANVESSSRWGREIV